MCTVFVAIKKSPVYPFILMANRDEFLTRPASRMSWWTGEKPILAGKDLEAGGTWLGLTESGSIAIVTNVRDMRDIRDDVRSRGDLVTDFLKSKKPAEIFRSDLHSSGSEYNGYNLLFGNMETLYFKSNKAQEQQILKSGIHGLSNAQLDTPWPKVSEGKTYLQNMFTAGKEQIRPEILLDELTSYMQNEKVYSANLPDTGIGEEWERGLSALYINAENYGTRVTTVILKDADGRIFVRENNRRDGEVVDFVV
jgi:uncharacterized protein with NRDE domain